ncbi:MAG: pyruvate dehydrogenase (acetyl-transferring), homodimeric type, partial [Actinomycetota bacterium]|nr:pyruvate dehydrogenase (acetyl-transferring), homodimeric type [Actinomycetota bacterium]
NCLVYDPAFAYELAVIIADGCKRMFADLDDVFYYLTLYNENYPMPEMPEGSEAGILRGLYRFADAPAEPSVRATIIFSGTSWLAAAQARDELAEHYDVGAELWSATSYKALRDDALSTERWNRLHPSQSPRTPWVTEVLSDAEGPYVAVSDYMKAVPDQVGRWVPGTFVPLGTDGFGRSDTRHALRRHFETDAAHVVVAVLSALAAEGQVKASAVDDAIARYGIDAEAPDPLLS